MPTPVAPMNMPSNLQPSVEFCHVPWLCEPSSMNLYNPELSVAREPVLNAVRALYTGVPRKPQRIAAFLAQARADPYIRAALVTEAAPITLLEHCSTLNLPRVVM